MSRRYRLVDVEEAIAESEDLADVADDIAETDEDMQLVIDRKSTRLNSSHYQQSRMPSSA